MIIGVDFDNTIADYTGVFYRVALNLGWIPEHIGSSKEEVKQFFISQDREAKWTELQGIVYGKQISQAKPYPDSLVRLQQLKNQGHELRLVSHKTKYPIIGDKVNFHKAAKGWLETHGFVNCTNAPFDPQHVYFNETKDKKVQIIQSLSCDFFIDDLESILLHEYFPNDCQGILFSPNKTHCASHLLAQNWTQIPALIV
ncbi:HAD family hydrolase [Pseudoalteromonas umbrosa]|uniref:HAD family hydrolase n=1 Tax=Pseudoalteromonas umbrosa TaxID=3048489 RepID=UPI0024C30B3E|nr:HAD family hydrolase [Pseudoalteromonas sp. B95]MDK1285619.1 HAD family hydrolase [Pseudoalteromonas sp. B95]